MIRSELKYLIGAKILGMRVLGFPVETGPNAMVWVFHMVRRIETVPGRFQPEPGTEPRI